MLTLLTVASVLLGQTLAAGQTVWVRPVAESSVHETVAEGLRQWGHWKIVDKEEDATLSVRIILTKKPGIATLVAHVETKTGERLWSSKPQTGRRTVFGGYQDPQQRATKGLIDQFKKAGKDW